MDAQLNGYVGEDVTIRFDPRDLSYIRVYKDNVLVCKAYCFELSGKTMSLQEVRQARNHEAKAQRNLLNELLSTADKHSPRLRYEAPPAVPSNIAPSDYPKLKIRRFACDLDRESKTVSDDKPI
jgi:putative transposase